MAILKYMLHLTSEQTLTLHKDAKILDAQAQNNVIALWADVPGRVIAAETSESFTIYMVPTGADVPDDCRYLRTLQIVNDGDVLVVHIYVGEKAGE